MAKSRQQMAGKHLNSVVIAPLKTGAYVSGDGAPLADNGGAAGASLAVSVVDGIALSGTVEEIEFEQSYETEDATMLGQEHASEVSGVHSITCTMTEILQYRNGNFLQGVFNNNITQGDGDDHASRVAQVAIKRAGSVLTFVGNLRSYRETYRKGKNVGILVISGIDPQTALSNGTTWQGNPSIAGYSRTNGI